MDPRHNTLPIIGELTIQNITENVIRINSQTPDIRLRYILERLVRHLHDFARETRLSTEEWMVGINFLTQVGQISSDIRQEFILLSDILGLSLLVDSIDHPKPAQCTEGTVLGPFHTHEAPMIKVGDSISHDPDGDLCLAICSVKDIAGNPIEGAKVDIWETDSKGFYDVQYGERQGPDGRCVITSSEDGSFWFKAIVPVPYPIPHDGPVGKLLKALKRHPYRPSHMHFMFEKSGYDYLITYVQASFLSYNDLGVTDIIVRSLYVKGSPYEASDAVFGVKETLIVELGTVNREQADRYSVKEGTKLIAYDFVLVSDEEARNLREKNAMEAMEKLGQRMKLLDGLPVPDVD